jgi:NADH dehydrogenase
MAGVDTVVSAVHGFAGSGGVSPSSVDRGGNANLIDAAAAEGAGVVLMSVVGASPASPMELFRMKHAAEEHLRGSAAPWTIVRATAYLETWVGLLEQTATRSGRPVVFGRGQNPINFVSAGDVAALLERAVIDRSARGKVLEIGGPQDMTLDQLAAAVQKAAGRTEEPRHVPRIVLHAMATVMGPFKPALARQARAALVMDSADMAFDASGIHDAYPDLPSTRLSEVLAHREKQAPASETRKGR